MQDVILLEWKSGRLPDFSLKEVCMLIPASCLGQRRHRFSHMPRTILDLLARKADPVDVRRATEPVRDCKLRGSSRSGQPCD